MADLPKTITVGPFTYKVLTDRKGFVENQLGATVFAQQTITVDDRQAKDSLADTVLHEVLHAVWSMSGVADEAKADIEERTIRRITPILLGVLRDNPELVKYLTK